MSVTIVNDAITRLQSVRSSAVTWIPELPERDLYIGIVFCALVTHAIFNRWEPMRLSIVGPLLLGVPAALSLLLMRSYTIFAAIATAFAVYHATLLASIVAYRLSPFHPLARYPGPTVAKISKFWHVWIVSGGKQHLYIADLHAKYGDIVRMGPNEVSIRDATCIKGLLGSTGLPKGPMWDGRNMYTHPPALAACRDLEMHAKRRKPWNRAFNTTSLKEFQPVIAKRVHQLADGIAAKKGQVVDLAQWFSFFTYDFMGDMAFGGWTEMMRDGVDKDGLWSLINRGLDISVKYEHVPWVAYYVKSLFPWAAGDLRAMRKMGFDRTELRYSEGSKTKDLFYYLSNEDNAEKVSPPRHVVISDGVLAIIAGADTTSSVLANLFWCILQKPDMYKRLREEVDHYYPPGEDSLDGKFVNDMPYLEAVVNEALRLWPAVLSGSQRASPVGKGGRAIGPYFIPEGTQARIHFFSVHRDPRNFSYPNDFWPDRWLIAEGIQESKEKIVHNPDAFIPFSFGPASCVGKNLAVQEMRMVVCHMMQRLDLRFEDGWDTQQWLEDMEDKFGQKLGKLPVFVSVRD